MQLNVKELNFFISQIRNVPLNYGYVTERFLNERVNNGVNNLRLGIS